MQSSDNSFLKFSASSKGRLFYVKWSTLKYHFQGYPNVKMAGNRRKSFHWKDLFELQSIITQHMYELGISRSPSLPTVVRFFFFITHRKTLSIHRCHQKFICRLSIRLQNFKKSTLRHEWKNSTVIFLTSFFIHHFWTIYAFLFEIFLFAYYFTTFFFFVDAAKRVGGTLA